jgi:phosphoesterase RecJ-like protein
MQAILNSWHAIVPEILARRSFAILSHVRPDGDAFGSVLALTLTLEALGKTAHAFIQDGLTDAYAFLPGSHRIEITPSAAPDVDAVIALDNAAYPRLGSSFLNWNTPVWLNIDHHGTNDRYGQHNFIDPDAPATGQLLYELFTAAAWPISPSVADNLFVAMSTDTGSFKYRNTTQRTFEVAAALAAHGARIGDLSNACYLNYPLRRLKLQQAILRDLKLIHGERIAYYSVTQAMYRDADARPEDTEGLVEGIIATEGVDVAIVFDERRDGTTKMSFRSKGAVNVSAIAQQFGGGGHPSAAGAQIPCGIADAQARVLPLAEAALS